MGFWDDLKMGIGAAPKTQDFVDRTAKTIERNQGSNAASTYSNQMTNKVNENTGKNFENKYTPSEGSQAVIDPFKNDDNNKAAQSAQASPAASNAGAASNQSFSDDGSAGTSASTQSDSPYTTLNKDTRGYVNLTTNAERAAIGEYLHRQDQAAGLGLTETIKKIEILSGVASPNVTEDYYRAVA